MTDPHIPPNIDFDEDGNVKRSSDFERLLERVRLEEWQKGWKKSAAAFPICRHCGREVVTEEGCAW